jgi:PAS domain S-box-containing protein
VAHDACHPYPFQVDTEASPAMAIWLLIYDDCATHQRLRLAIEGLSNAALQAVAAEALDETTAPADVLLLECTAALLPRLALLHTVARKSSALVIGLLSHPLPAAAQAAFDSACHAFVDPNDQSVRNQIVQHLRWHERLSSYAPKRRRAFVSQRQFDRQMKHLRPYAAFFRHSPEAMIVVDQAGTIQYTNPAARLLAGVSGVTGPRSVFEYLEPVEVERARGLARQLVTTPQAAPTDFSITTYNGQRVVSVHASKVQLAPGTVLLTFRDVTIQRELERTLIHTKNFLQQVIDSSVDAIVSADLQGNILVFNRAAGRIFDYAPGDVIGKMNVRKLYPTGGAESMMRLIRSHERDAGGQLEGHQTQMLDRQGNIVPVRLSAAFVRQGRSVVATVGVFTDIRQELALAEKLRQAEAELHEREKGLALAQLAGMTAHELNQPLTIILGYSELLQRICTQPDARQTADILANQAQRLAEIVRRIGRITRYETQGYVGGAAILDLERATHDDTEA